MAYLFLVTFMRPLIQKRLTQIGLFVLSTAILLFCVRAFIFQLRQTHARTVARDWGAAIWQSEQLPPGLARGDDMLARLKQVDIGSAPVELKQAITDYIAAFQGRLDAVKTGRDPKPFEEAMDQARLRIVAAMKEYS